MAFRHFNSTKAMSWSKWNFCDNFPSLNLPLGWVLVEGGLPPRHITSLVSQHHLIPALTKYSHLKEIKVFCHMNLMKRTSAHRVGAPPGCCCLWNHVDFGAADPLLLHSSTKHPTCSGNAFLAVRRFQPLFQLQVLQEKESKMLTIKSQRPRSRKAPAV